MAILKQTTSRCPQCRLPCSATVEEKDGKVYLHRICLTHGPATACIASDSRFYWLAQGKDDNRCCPGGTCCNAQGQPVGLLGQNIVGKTDNTFETLSTCLALIEIVDSCNLACPTCFADSPVGVGSKVAAVPLEQLQARIDGVIARKGKLEVLQLSGGEPTLHPQLLELCRWVKAHPKIDFLLLNTNGVRFAKEPALCAALGEIFRTGKLQIYLQFDGIQEAGQKTLRGADLRALRAQALANLRAEGITVTLAMTVNRENLGHLWEAVAFGLADLNIHGITFQPEFTSGRGPARLAPPDTVPERLNTADLILAAVEQSGGQLRFEDFTPLPCGDPNCATMGYLLRHEGRIMHVSDFLDFSQFQGFLKDKVRYTVEDLARCGCETEPLGHLLQGMEKSKGLAFRLMVKPFMDAWTWDDDRIDRCCTHVIRPDGKLDSFCRYYSGFPDTKTAP